MQLLLKMSLDKEAKEEERRAEIDKGGNRRLGARPRRSAKATSRRGRERKREGERVQQLGCRACTQTCPSPTPAEPNPPIREVEVSQPLVEIPEQVERPSNYRRSSCSVWKEMYWPEACKRRVVEA